MSKYYSIGEFSEKTGVTVRTLHYYDEIGLLKPAATSKNGRRKYSNESLITLQKIITLKYIGFSLEKIKEFLQNDRWNLEETISLQKKILVEQKQQIEEAISALDHALYAVGHEEEVDAAVLISLINSIQTEDKQKELLSKAIGRNKVEKIFTISDEKKLEIERSFVKIHSKVKKLYTNAPDSPEVQRLVEEYLSLVHEVIGEDLGIIEGLENIDLDDEIWFFSSPFSKEEEEWFAEGVNIYLEQKGVNPGGN